MEPLLTTLIVVAIITLVIISVVSVVLGIKGSRTLDSGYSVLSRLDRVTGNIEQSVGRAGGLLDMAIRAAERGVERFVGRKQSGKRSK